MWQNLGRTEINNYFGGFDQFAVIGFVARVGLSRVVSLCDIDFTILFCVLCVMLCPA